MAKWAAAMVLCLYVTGAYAQPGAKMQIISGLPTPATPNAIPLYSGNGPESKNPAQKEQWDTFIGQRIVRNVVYPTLTPVLPKPSIAAKAAVIVAPGGAFKFLSIDNEGYQVARWLADHGIAAFVLKYRLRQTPRDPNAFLKSLEAMAKSVDRDSGKGVSEPAVSLRDGQAAIAYVRAHAGQWSIDPHRIGFLGFSAGAALAIRMGLLPNAADRPDFVAPIYGPMYARDVPADAPPLFAALASNDPLFGGGHDGLVKSWLAAGRPAELHIYVRGSHGFGMRKYGSTSDHWIREFYWWLQAMHFLTTK